MIENYQALAKYNKLMNAKLYDLASNLLEEELKKNYGSFFGSLFNTLNHLVLADKIWLNRFATQNTRFSSLTSEILEIPNGFKSLNQIVFEDFQELKAHRIKMDLAIETMFKEMPEDFPNTIIKYANTQGVEREHVAWISLTHFFNHQTHHRGQITAILSQMGLDYGVTDLIALI